MTRPAPLPVAVFVSGGGTNLQALLDALRDSPVARIDRVVSNRADAAALARAGRATVRTIVLANPDDPAEIVAAPARVGSRSRCALYQAMPRLRRMP